MNLKFNMLAWLRLFETHAPNIICKVPEKGSWSTCDVKKWAAHCICVIGIYVQLCTYPGKSVKNCRKMPRKNTSLVGSGGEERVIPGAATNKLCGKKDKGASTSHLYPSHSLHSKMGSFYTPLCTANCDRTANKCCSMMCRSNLHCVTVSQHFDG